jgi:hypothetical protein
VNRLMLAGAAVTMATSLLAMWFVIIGIPFAVPYVLYVLAGGVVGITMLTVGLNRLDEEEW